MSTLRKAVARKICQRKTLRRAALALGILGLCLIGWRADPIAAAGVFLAIWGNNLEQQTR